MKQEGAGAEAIQNIDFGEDLRIAIKMLLKRNVMDFLDQGTRWSVWNNCVVISGA